MERREKVRGRNDEERHEKRVKRRKAGRDSKVCRKNEET